MSSQPAPKKSAFPWIPVLIVGGLLSLSCCGVCGVGGAFLYYAQQESNRARSKHNLMQIGLAVHNLSSSYQVLPRVSGPWADLPPLPGKPPRDVTIFFCLLPYIEQDNLYRQLLAEGSGASTNVLIPTYVNPDDTTGNGMQGECNYAANWQLFQTEGGKWPQIGYISMPRSFPDGTSFTVMFAEIYQNCNGTVRKWGQTGTWKDNTTPAFNRMEKVNPSLVNPSNLLPQLAPKPFECAPTQAQTPYSKGAWVGLGDGSVRAVDSRVSLTTWQRVCCPADANAVGPDW
jgi:hypothetical protein